MVGYSETAFIEQTGEEGTYRVRYFSPLAEVAFCGHATIATAVAIAERRGSGALSFDTQAGLIGVDTADDTHGLTATLTSVPTRTRPAAAPEGPRRSGRCAGARTTSTRRTRSTSRSLATTTSSSHSGRGSCSPSWTTTSTGSPS